MELAQADVEMAVVADDVAPLGDGLAETIERAVRRETGFTVRDLIVEVTREGVLLKGRCESFYSKVMAQHAAMNTPGAGRLVNAIEVG